VLPLKIKFLYCLIIMFTCTATVHAKNQCNPTVQPTSETAIVSQQLIVLAEKYNFSLTFPKGLDDKVVIEDSMKLDQLIKLLTSGMNTILRHEKMEGCSESRLVELEVIPVGEETEFVSYRPTTKPHTQEYIYIEDMEQYATEVLMRERKADVRAMTPEQRVEFKTVKNRLKAELKDEIKQSKKDKRKEKKKNKAKKVDEAS
jgi:hypothetical protein